MKGTRTEAWLVYQQEAVVWIWVARWGLRDQAVPNVFSRCEECIKLQTCAEMKKPIKQAPHRHVYIHSYIRIHARVLTCASTWCGVFLSYSYSYQQACARTAILLPSLLPYTRETYCTFHKCFCACTNTCTPTITRIHARIVYIHICGHCFHKFVHSHKHTCFHKDTHARAHTHNTYACAHTQMIGLSLYFFV